jgi:ribonuclease P protein component
VPKSYLLSGVEIRAFRPQRRLHGTYLSLGVAPRPAHARAGVAFIVSKQVSPKAAVRNAIKRTLREAARPLLKSIPPLSLVVSVKRTAGTAEGSALRADLTALLADAAAVAKKEERATMPQS